MGTAGQSRARDESGRSQLGSSNLRTMRRSQPGIAGLQWHALRCVALAIGLLVGLCLAPSALAETSVVAPTEGPPLSTPELVAATPNGDLLGIGSDGGAGVWFAEDGSLHEDAFMVHYVPTDPALTRLPLTVASPFNEVIQSIAPGPKGTEWFARFYDNEISHITARGKLVTKKLPRSSEPQDVAVSQQGTVWFTERGHGCALGQLSPKGKLTTYPPIGADCYDLTIGPSETVWVADYASNQVVEVSGTTGEVITRYNLRLPVGIATVGEDIYVTEDEPAVVAKITPEGEVTEYVLPEGRKLEGMTAGPDEAVWFDEIIGAGGVPAIGRLTPSGELREAPVPGSGGGDIAATNDAIYFTEGSGPEAGVMRIPASSSGGGGGVVRKTGSSLSYNPFDVPRLYGECTYWADHMFGEYTDGIYLNVIHDAYLWANEAQAGGWTVTATPEVDSVVVFPPGEDGAGKDGHVAWVEQVSGSKIYVSEMHFPQKGVEDHRWATVTPNLQFILAP